MPEIEIRHAVVSDIPKLLELEHSFQTSYVWQMDRSFDKGQWTINFREVRLPRPAKVEYPVPTEILGSELTQRSGLLVAFISNEPVGYIGIKAIQVSETASVIDLVVKEELRRKGIGSALLLAAQDWASQRDLLRMVIEMQSKNFPAIHLALKMGYEFCGYNDQYYATRDIALFFSRFLR
ncbi:MAG TPA: GNAT family N-acetyltransferase [Anaerolineaceae bacterium]|nr:GNAT family N-acetyltransferase [Anaerolineaceae bacterium]